MSRYFLSFDIEDWFHAHNMKPMVDRSDWETAEQRVSVNTRRILDLLDNHEIKATFFILGWVADRYPDLVEEIDSRGHEVASHGYNHKLLYEQSQSDVRSDIERSLDVLEPLVSQSIRGYRAPSFSITDWAVDILSDLGFKYDSSSFPFDTHDRYGRLTHPEDSTETIATLNENMTEVQLPLLDLPGISLPWAGGGYFRVMPYPVYQRGLKRIARSRDVVFYLHPWDLDPDQPQFDELPLSYRLRHYTNLDRTADRLNRLLEQFDWQPIGSAV
ncbi:XrtA system polysaccharide deacetylase [Halomicrobium sp. LC1Hm]|uniref:XrtA system polysaccharide deacetylase n=1 Tax=Halomicrobium sp. LC1Hm TaxID=2610902 RepID=UPI0012985126|nr:XrtA system polysaccharide deacetylase [Halomicrobium sp. LC1Hm]QGA81903.1 Polysaccharide deacetylase [Halomicrobium sp. LC1Hm]